MRPGLVLESKDALRKRENTLVRPPSCAEILAAAYPGVSGPRVRFDGLVKVVGEHSCVLGNHASNVAEWYECAVCIAEAIQKQGPILLRDPHFKERNW